MTDRTPATGASGRPRTGRGHLPSHRPWPAVNGTTVRLRHGFGGAGRPVRATDAVPLTRGPLQRLGRKLDG